MSKRLEEIVRRKQALITRAAQQRAELGTIYKKICSPIELSGTLVGLGRVFKAHPLIITAASSFIVSGYAGRLVKSTGSMLKLWRLAFPIWLWWRSRRKTP